MGKKKTNNINNSSTPAQTAGVLSESVIQYDGYVNIQLQTNSGKKITFKGHNEGMPLMFKYLCKALAGKITDLSSEKPVYIDIKCIYSDELDTTTGEVVTKKTSCLYNPLSISSPEYFYDAGTNQWKTRYNITLSYNMINFDVVDSHQGSLFYIYLISANDSEFARLNLTNSGEILNQILPGTQALIEWTLVFTNSTVSAS